MLKKRLSILLATLCTSMSLVGCTKNTSDKIQIISKDVSITNEDGLVLRGYLEGPKKSIESGKSCPLIILMHGLMDSGEFNLIRKQADSYTAAGYAVLAMDFDGHGKSDGELIDMTISKELLDAEAIFSYAKQLTFASETILIGHSQGGVIASITAARHSNDIDKLVLLAPGGALADKMRNGSFFGQTFDPNDPPERLQAFDDYVGRDYIVDAISLDLYGLAEGYSNHSVLLVRGSDDPLVTEEAMQKYETIYQKPEFNNTVTSSVIDGAPHDFYEYEDQVVSTVSEFLS